jgi:hypothetical protein
MFHEFFHIPEDSSGHVGTARNVAGLHVVDVVEYPEWCSGPERVAKVEVVSSNLISRSKGPVPTGPFFGGAQRANTA